MKFTKMHGAGNDYIYVDCTQSVIDNPSQVAIDLSDRHFGIGSDGLILIKKSDKADFFMEMYNAWFAGTDVWQWNKMCWKVRI